MAYLFAYVTALILFFLADMAWLGTMSNRLYKPTLGDILLATVDLRPAIAFYLLYPVGLVVFAIGPALRAASPSTALGLGALFGLFTYATYDLTNQATLRNWSTALTLVDVAWGSLLGAGVSVGACCLVAKFS